MQKYGFIYIWRDKKHSRYYIGRHWGSENDGYICSSRSMRDAHRYRPNDFKRRTVSIVHDKTILVQEEQRWLNMIKKEELGIRYYNKTLKSDVPSMHGRKHTEETKAKMREKAKGRKLSEEHKEKVRQANLGKTYCKDINAKKGRPFSEERKQMISEKMKEHFKLNPRSIETRKKISENGRRLQAEGKIGMFGKSHSKDTVEKMKKNWKNQFSKNKQGREFVV